MALLKAAHRTPAVQHHDGAFVAIAEAVEEGLHELVSERQHPLPKGTLDLMGRTLLLGHPVNVLDQAVTFSPRLVPRA